MNKVNSGIKLSLKKDWEKVCTGYLLELLNMWDLDACYGYWVGDDVGGLYDYDSVFTITMDNIIYCVENDITEDEYIEWQDYVFQASEYGFTRPNFKSWAKGCPRVGNEVFDRLRSLKENFDKIINEESEKIGKYD